MNLNDSLAMFVGFKTLSKVPSKINETLIRGVISMNIYLDKAHDKFKQIDRAVRNSQFVKGNWIKNLVTSISLMSRMNTIINSLNITQSLFVTSIKNASTAFRNFVSQTLQKPGKGLFKGIKDELTSIYSTGKKLVGFLEPSLKAAGEQIKLKDTFIARTGSESVGTAMFEKYRKEALRAGVDVDKYLAGALGNLGITQNSGQLSELNRLAAQMNAMEPEGKFEDAASAINSALKGDTSSLAKQFKMPEKTIDAFNLKELAQTKDIDGFIQQFDRLLESAGMGREAFEAMMDSPINQWTNLVNVFQNQLALVGQSGLEAFSPLFDMLITMFESGQLDPFFNALAVGFEMFASFITWLGSFLPPAIELVKAGIAKVSEIFTGMIPIFTALGPMIAGMASAFLFYVMVTTLYNTIAQVTKMVITSVAMAMRVLNLTMLATPIGLIIALLALAVGWFITLQAKTHGVRKTFSNVFGAIVDTVETAINYMVDIINKFIRGINDLSGFFAGLLGIDHKAIGEIEFRADFSGFKEAGQDFIEDFSMDDIMEKFSVDKIGDQGDPGALELWDKQHPNIPIPKTSTSDIGNIGKVGEVGKIRDDVDISSEDLKIMRELAELNNIQNFVTLNPTVSFGDTHVQNESDINTIISRIEAVMAEERLTGASGSYE